jgi:hypothetical protein
MARTGFDRAKKFFRLSKSRRLIRPFPVPPRWRRKGKVFEHDRILQRSGWRTVAECPAPHSRYAHVRLRSGAKADPCRPASGAACAGADLRHCQRCTPPASRGNALRIEDNLIHFPSGSYRAVAIRAYDRSSQSWAIWRLSSANPHLLDTPVIGRFEGDTGTFFAKDKLNGRPITLRFLWLNTESRTPRWEQAMSADGGASWETNWVMEFEPA